MFQYFSPCRFFKWLAKHIPFHVYIQATTPVLISLFYPPNPS